MSDERDFYSCNIDGKPVGSQTVDRVVLELFDLSGEFDAEYDGWETSVEKGS